MSDFDTHEELDTTDSESVVKQVRERYAAFASAGTSCCGPAAPSCCGDTETVAQSLGYESIDLDLLPEGANLGLGCGAPLQHLELAEGETVVDLGSGAGIDALIAGRAVGPRGRAIRVDMTPGRLEDTASSIEPLSCPPFPPAAISAALMASQLRSTSRGVPACWSAKT